MVVLPWTKMLKDRFQIHIGADTFLSYIYYRMEIAIRPDQQRLISKVQKPVEVPI
jgi:hypothetical protein